MSELDRAQWYLEQALDGVLAFTKGAGYGLRLAHKRIGELSMKGSPAAGGASGAHGDVGDLAEVLHQSDDRLSDLVVLALGDHFRSFLGRALELDEPPPLPPTPGRVEQLAGTPGAFPAETFWFAVGLLLYHATLQGGALNSHLLKLFGGDVEIIYPGGKVKRFQNGDHVTLVDAHFQRLADAYLDAARAVRQRILTA